LLHHRLYDPPSQNTYLDEEIVREGLEPDRLDGGGLGLRRRREEVVDDLHVPESLEQRRERDPGPNRLQVEFHPLSVGLEKKYLGSRNSSWLGLRPTKQVSSNTGPRSVARFGPSKNRSKAFMIA